MFVGRVMSNFSLFKGHPNEFINLFTPVFLTSKLFYTRVLFSNYCLILQEYVPTLVGLELRIQMELIWHTGSLLIMLGKQ